MSHGRTRAWWWQRQGLDGSLRGEGAAAVLERCGWSRSVGGVGPYLTLFARARIGREEADRAVAGLEIHELPTARGCTYVVPASDFAIGLAVGDEFANAPIRQAAKLGVTSREIERLCTAVLRALEAGRLDPDGIRAATGTASRSLGEEGKKKGLSTTLPLALGVLQAKGSIRRVPVNGRLDQQRYQYTLWQPNPRASYDGSADDAMAAMAMRFFRSVGPASLAEFRFFSALGKRAAMQALEPLGLVPADPDSDRLLLPDDVDAYRAFVPSKDAQYALVSSLDPISANRRDVKSLLEPADLERAVLDDREMRPIGALSDLPSHAILDRGRLVGLWEYDVDTQSIVRATFGVRDRTLDAVVQETETFVRDELGDARSFSLDSPKSRAPRIAALRAAR